MYLFLLFIIYAFIGYVVETSFRSIDLKKFSNRGFLVGPVIPVFGIGAILLIMLLDKYQGDYLVIFIFGMIICGLVENLTGLILEKIFHNKWWDYSNRRDNINGYLCFGNLIIFAISAVGIVCFFNPWLGGLLVNVKEWVIVFMGGIILLLFLVDIVYSVRIAYELRMEIIIAEELKAKKLKALPVALEKLIKERLSRIKVSPLRFFKVFPNLSNYKNGDILHRAIVKIKNERKKIRIKLKNFKLL